MGFSFWHLLVVLLVVLVIFGAGKLPNVMGDIGRGIRSFKSGLSGDQPPEDKNETENPPRIPPSKDKEDR